MPDPQDHNHTGHALASGPQSLGLTPALMTALMPTLMPALARAAAAARHLSAMALP